MLQIKASSSTSSVDHELTYATDMLYARENHSRGIFFLFWCLFFIYFSMVITWSKLDLFSVPTSKHFLSFYFSSVLLLPGEHCHCFIFFALFIQFHRLNFQYNSRTKIFSEGRSLIFTKKFSRRFKSL